MPALLLANWRLVLEAVVVALLIAYGFTMRVQRDIARNEYSDFRREVALAAQKAAELALQRTIEDEKRKEAADADNLRLRSDLALLTKRLRDARANSGILPPTASCPGRPDSATFNATLLERALQQLDGEVSGLLEEGDRAIVDLETAKAWAKSR